MTNQPKLKRLSDTDRVSLGEKFHCHEANGRRHKHHVKINDFGIDKDICRNCGDELIRINNTWMSKGIDA